MTVDWLGTDDKPSPFSVTGGKINWLEGTTWDVNRLGLAAGATTHPGTPPAYGTVVDLATANGMTSDQFRDLARTIAETQQQPLLDLAQQGIAPSDHARELEIAQNYEKYGLSMDNASFHNTGDDAGFWDDVRTGLKMARNTVGQGVHELGELVGINEDEAPSYETYREKGGTLTEFEWESFSAKTRNELFDRANFSKGAQHVASQPGIKQGLYAMQQTYRGLTTGTAMVGDVGSAAWAPVIQARKKNKLALPDLSSLAIYTNGGRWKENWEATIDPEGPLSLGNAILDATLSPTVSQDTLDKWRRDSSLFAISSVGAEFAVAWHADLGVAALKAAGNLRRVARNEMPLNERGRMYTAIREAQQGRAIEAVSTPLAKKYAAWRAERTHQGFDGLVDYAKATDFQQFSMLPAFHGRAASGVAAAKAIHIAARSGDDKLIDLTRGALNGDTTALRTIQQMKEDPSRAGRFVNGTNFVQAWDAVKLKANQFETEIEKLEKARVSGAPRSHFGRWELDTDIALKEKELGEMKAWLEADSDYYDWLSSIGTTSSRKAGDPMAAAAVDPYNPQLERYDAPKTKWNDVEERFETVTHRRFMPDIFSKHHTVIKVPPSLVARRIGVVSMHDLNSGKRGVERFFNQVQSVLDFDDIDNGLRQEFNDRWAAAASGTNHDRYKVMYDMEEEVLLPALANKLGISEATARAVFDKINEERARTFEGLSSGKGRAYEAGPTFAQRLNDESNGTARVLEDDGGEMITVEFRDGQRLVTAEIPRSLLTPRVRPIDVTQTPNYYQPADVRRLYHEMKRHADVLREIDEVSGSKVRKALRHDAAHLAEINDILGTKFYSFWKPLQLWRLGWPQRVLMDEGFRAMAIFGPMYWITGEGAESVTTAARNTPAFLRDKYRAHKRGKVVLSDGPLAPKNKADNAFQWQQAAEKAVRLPAQHFPKVNPDRLARIDAINVEAGKAIAFRTRMLAVEREMTQVGFRADGEETALERLVKRERKQWKAKNPDSNVNYSRTMEDWFAYNDTTKRAELLKAIDAHPINQAIRHFEANRSVYTTKDASRSVALVYDPVSGKPVGQGYFVPLPNMGRKINGGKPYALEDANLLHWYEQNAELLSRRGIRVQMTREGNIEIGLWFNSKQRRRAEAAMKSVAESQPIGTRVTAYNLGKNETIELLDANHLSPFMESVQRLFQDENEYGPAEGIIPTTANPEGQVYHGTGGRLPSELQRREDTVAVNGNMVGPGLYTTMNKEMAESYGHRVYTIKNTRTGQRVEEFDLDQIITPEEAEAFFAWVEGESFAWEVADGFRAAERTRAEMDNETASYYSQFFTKKTGPNGSITWANFFEKTVDNQAKALITLYLEQVKNAGALKHMGGTTHNHPHQVYVWLRPEELEVIPAEVATGKHMTVRPLLNWLSESGLELNPQTTVPESRIVRFGKRNPMLRDLHTTHARLEARLAQLSGKARVVDPEKVELRRKEQALMEALGLEYRGRASGGDPDLEAALKPNVWGQDWYEVSDPDAFNRMLDEAAGMNGEIDWARAANGELGRAETDALLESRDFALEEFDFALDNIGSRIADKMKREYGAGKVRLRSGGRDYLMDDVFEGHLGRLTRGLTSSAPAMDNLTDAHTAALGMMRHQGAGHVRIHAPQMTGDALKVGTPQHKKAVLYFQRWADLMNNQVANSPVWGPMLKGARDEDVVKFLTETPAGHKHRREILEQHESVEAYVNEMRAKLDYYLPSNELRRRLAKGPIQPSDLRRKVHNDDLPDIYGPDLTLEDKKFTRALADNIWNALGTIPADKFSRQPFAKATYKRKVQSLLNQSRAEHLDQAALERIHTMAAEHTREQVRQHLFDLTDGTNMTDALRFIAPFWGAQEEAILKWAKIISDRPETVARFFNGQRAIYNNLMVLDEENQPVEQNREGGSFFGLGLGYHPTDKMVISIPEVVRKTPFGAALEHIGDVRIPIGSANTVLQGDMPLLPSFGPYVTMPADKFLRAWRETHGTEYSDNAMYRWLFPIGRPSGGAKGILEQLLPGWGRRAMGATGAEDDAVHANLYMQIAREMTLRNRRKGLPDPTPEQVEAASNLLWFARGVASFGAPVQLEFAPRNQFFADQAHRYKREMGADWETKFFEDFGEEAMIYAVSSSHSLVGVPPTSAGITGWEAHQKLIAKHPEFGGLIVGSDTYQDEFNHDAYEMQFETNLGPGDARTLRDISDPRERAAKAEESIGWLKFRKIDATVQAELYALGATSIQQTTVPGVSELARYRSEEVSKLMREYPAWALAWNTSERTIYQKVEALEDIAVRPEFDNRVDIQGLRDYLAIRDQAAEQLDLGYAGGYASRNLQAQENANLRNWFYDQVGTLIQNNPAFGELYSRYLSQDTLMQGSGGYGDQ